MIQLPRHQNITPFYITNTSIPIHATSFGYIKLSIWLDNEPNGIVLEHVLEHHPLNSYEREALRTRSAGSQLLCRLY